VSSAEIVGNAITGAKVQDASLGAVDIAAPNGGGSPIVGSVQLDPPNVTAGTCGIATGSVADVLSSDRVILNLAEPMDDALDVMPMTPTAGTLRARVCNRSGIDVDDTPRLFSYIVIR
jgi:hypothetical protein